ncbi:MAG: hypothetical protein WD025_02275 [Bacteriovoracaceae bacterium]
MEDLRSILTSHHNKSKAHATKDTLESASASSSEIPDLFFDEILIQYKMTRIEILLLMYLYRITWCRPNLHKKFGIAPIISHSDLAKSLDISIDMLHQNVRRLESFKFIETIRAGQYFVRKYFTEENDQKYDQTYDNFL